MLPDLRVGGSRARPGVVGTRCPVAAVQTSRLSLRLRGYAIPRWRNHVDGPARSLGAPRDRQPQWRDPARSIRPSQRTVRWWRPESWFPAGSFRLGGEPEPAHRILDVAVVIRRISVPAPIMERGTKVSVADVLACSLTSTQNAATRDAGPPHCPLTHRSATPGRSSCRQPAGTSRGRARCHRREPAARR